MRITENVNDRNRVSGVHIDVDLEVEHIGGTSSTALEVAERLETVIKEEIKAMGKEQEEDGLE